MAMNFLRRQQTVQARLVLQELVRKYPRSRVADDAREMLRQIPETAATPAPQPPAVARATPPTAARQPAPEASRAPEPSDPSRPGMITTDDLAARRRGPLLGERRTPAELPASLQSSKPAAPVQSAAAAQDDARVISITPESGRVVVSVQYNLASQRQKPVYVGAWVLTGGAARYFGYSSPISPGRGTTTVTLSGASPDFTNLRVAFFEVGGQRFFTKDLIIQK